MKTVALYTKIKTLSCIAGLRPHSGSEESLGGLYCEDLMKGDKTGNGPHQPVLRSNQQAKVLRVPLHVYNLDSNIPLYWHTKMSLLLGINCAPGLSQNPHRLLHKNKENTLYCSSYRYITLLSIDDKILAKSPS